MVTNHNKDNMRKRYSRESWETLERIAQRGCGVSAFLKIFCNPAGRGLEQHALLSALASFWTGGLYRWPPELHSKLHFFYDSMIFFWGLWPSYSHCSCEFYPYLFFPRTYLNSQGTGCLGTLVLYCYCWFLELDLAYLCTVAGNSAQALKQSSVALSMWTN